MACLRLITPFRESCPVDSFDWRAAVAIAVPVLGLLATMYTAFGSSARRLRNDLTTDVKLVAELSGDAKDDLQEGVTDRSYRLVAATRYPNLTWFEAALALLLAPVLWFLFSVPGGVAAAAERDELGFELAGAGQFMTLLFALVTYAALVRSWSRRSAERVVYVYRRLGDDQARALVQLLAFPAYLVPVIFFGALGYGVLINVKATTDAMSWPWGVGVLITMPIVFALAAALYLIASREELSDYVHFYTDPLHAGADIPRLRPVALGRTDEDLALYKAASDRRFPPRRQKEK